MTSKEEIIDEEQVNNGAMTEMNKPYKFDDDVVKMKTVRKPSVRKKIYSVRYLVRGS